ncbi:MAG: RHS repeat protein, partial [Phycisphaerae bacterium]|nr:RHS repeat protein [Phycisphaerae bacterium]
MQCETECSLDCNDCPQGSLRQYDLLGMAASEIRVNADSTHLVAGFGQPNLFWFGLGVDPYNCGLQRCYPVGEIYCSMPYCHVGSSGGGTVLAPFVLNHCAVVTLGTGEKIKCGVDPSIHAAVYNGSIQFPGATVLTADGDEHDTALLTPGTYYLAASMNSNIQSGALECNFSGNAMCSGDGGVVLGFEPHCVVGSIELSNSSVCPGDRVTARAVFACAGYIDPSIVDVWTTRDDEEGLKIKNPRRDGNAFVCDLIVGENPGNGIITIIATEPGFGCEATADLLVPSLDAQGHTAGDGGEDRGVCCGGKNAMGVTQAASGPPRMSFSLGSLSDGSSAGAIVLASEEGSYFLGKRRSLAFHLSDPQVEAVYDLLGLRQVLTPHALADIVDMYRNDPEYGDQYEIRLYAEGSYGTTKGPDGLYPLLPSPTLLHTWVVSNSGAPDSGDQLIVAKYLGDSATGTLQASYEYLHSASVPGEQWSWQLTTKDGQSTVMRQETIEWETDTPSAGFTTKTYTAQSGVNEIRRVEEVWKEFPWGLSVVSRTISTGVAGSLLQTTYDYYETGTATGKLALIEEPDDSWTGYHYDLSVTEIGTNGPEVVSTNGFAIVRGWLDETVPAVGFLPSYDASGVVSTLTTYSDEPGSTAGRPLTVTEFSDGHMTGRTEYSYDTAVPGELKVTEVRTDGGAGLATERRYDLNHDERILSEWRPDGVFAVHDYEEGTFDGSTTAPQFTPLAGGADLRICVSSGTSSDGETISYVPGKSTKECVVRDLGGNPVLQETYVTEDTSEPGERASWTVRVFDNLNRETDVHQSNGTHESTEWTEDSCCGTRTVTNAEGIEEESVTDLLGRLTRQTRVGVLGGPGGLSADQTTVYQYDYGTSAVTGGLERTVTATTTSSAGGDPLASQQRFDLAGRLMAEEDALGLLTIMAYTNGGRTSTVTRPGGATEITDHYLDGQLKSISGTGVMHRAYGYAVPQDGRQTMTVMEGTADPVQGSLRQTTTTTDWLGRTVIETRPAFDSGVLTTTYAYNTDGQLVRTEIRDPSNALVAAPTLYEYDDLGNVAKSGLDVDGNGVLEAAGTDRFTANTTTYVNDGTDWWRTTASTAYSDGADDYVTTTQKSRLTGFSGSMTAEGVTTVDYYRDGNKVATQTGGTVTTTNRSTKTVTQATTVPGATTAAVTVAVNGLLQSSTSSSGVDTTYGYDGFGRQTTVTDGRGNTQTTHYNAVGRVDWTENAHGDRTTFGYDPDSGQLTSNGSERDGGYNYTYYAYTLRGDIEKMWGDVPQPVLFTYDIFGQRETMTTFRGTEDFTGNQWPGQTAEDGDTTTWVYDPATGLLTDKEYADGKATSYTYYPDGKLHERLWAREDALSSRITTTYTYDANTGEMLTVDYSDTAYSPDLTFAHTRSGQLASVTAADPESTDHVFDYSAWPQEVTETISGLYERAITRTFEPSAGSRPTGLSVDWDQDREYTAAYHYNSASGRMDRITGPGLPAYGAVYGYLEDASQNPTADLIHQIDFRSDASTTIARIERDYEDTRDLIDQVTNTWDPAGTPVVVSRYDYTNDVLGRRTNVEYSGSAFAATVTQAFGYNTRNELTGSARADVGDWAYAYDNIGNRETASGPLLGPKAYTPNQLNQYALINSGPLGTPYPLFHDDDGNLTIDDEGRSLEYDAENRLVAVTTPRVIYVDATRPALGADGRTWETAYPYLQSALADAANQTGPVQIWVADGEYYPDEGTGQVDNARTSTFTLLDHVSILGGFAGYGAGNPDARDPAVYETILNGDLDQNDCGYAQGQPFGWSGLLAGAAGDWVGPWVDLGVQGVIL